MSEFWGLFKENVKVMFRGAFTILLGLGSFFGFVGGGIWAGAYLGRHWGAAGEVCIATGLALIGVVLCLAVLLTLDDMEVGQ